jgi:hypothetical protein
MMIAVESIKKATSAGESVLLEGRAALNLYLAKIN